MTSDINWSSNMHIENDKLLDGRWKFCEAWITANVPRTHLMVTTPAVRTSATSTAATAVDGTFQWNG